ncbi:E3 ubiquitin-protein ligase TRIM56-like isoform X2 [Scleropages formosus]|uniref:E3 ubiquitin-protein ligase TRIM56-like isoform X2 n=1 Tax=Scleropages formosus TaxID=113540 RepID=UPI0008781D8F|nr:E3 ubiquitin-protein ligase TRIM56-like isoform X2 [Scleropages formosus]
MYTSEKCDAVRRPASRCWTESDFSSCRREPAIPRKTKLRQRHNAERGRRRREDDAGRERESSASSPFFSSEDTSLMASQLSDKIKEDFLECKICFEVYQTPRTLSCLHSFCEPCLRQLLDKEKGTVTCPDCRTVSDLQGNVQNAKASFFINSLLDLFHSKTTKETVCSVCLALGKNNVSASSRCLDCADFLCSSCAQSHCLSKLTLDHGVVSLTDYIAGCHDEEARLKLERRCQSHGEPLRFYCDTCAVAICRDCRMLEHFSHQVQSLVQAATARKPQLEQLISSLDGNIESLSQKEKEVDSAIQELREAHAVVEDQISGHLSAIIEQLFAQKEAFTKDLALSVEEQQQKYLSIKEDLQRLVSSAQNTRDFSSQVLQKGKDCEILDLEGTIQGQIERLQKVSVPEIANKIPVLGVNEGSDIDWSFSKMFKLSFGTSSLSTTDPKAFDTDADTETKVLTQTSAETVPPQPAVPPASQLCEPQPQKTFHSPVEQQLLNPPTVFSLIRTIAVDDACNPLEENITGMSLFPSRDIVIADNANFVIKRVVRNGDIRKTIYTAHRGWNNLDPFSIAVCDDSIFFTSGCRLYRIPDEDDDDFIQVCNLRGSHQEYSITAYKDEYIAVSEGTNCSLSLYSPEGVLVDRVSPPSSDGKFVFVAVNSKEEFIVSDTKRKCVLLISRNGNILNTCSLSNFNPTSVCVDKYDNIYVVDGKKIFLLTPSGVFLRQLFHFKSYTPKLITCDQYGHLIVANRVGTIRIYKETFLF